MANVPEILPPHTTSDQTILEMADEIRSMDDLIFRMSMCESWSAMRPIFLELKAKMAQRRTAESNRITNIMRRELLSVYTKPKG